MPDPILITASKEIEEILMKHDIAGVVLLTSKTHSEFLMHLDPTWSVCTFEKITGGRVLRFKAKRADFPSKEAQGVAISDSIGIIMGLRDAAQRVVGDMTSVAEMLAKHVDFNHISRLEERDDR